MKPIKQISSGEAIHNVEGIVSGLKVSTTKTGKDWASFKLSDKTGSIDAKVWEWGAGEWHQIIKDGAIVSVSGESSEYKGQVQLTVRLAGTVPFPDKSKFEKCSEFPVAKMITDLYAYIDAFEGSCFKPLAQKMFSVYGDRFSDSPAATGMHHAFRHGLIEHTLQMLQTAEALLNLPIYKRLNRDLVMFGVLFHDFGKIFEYSMDAGYPKTTSGLLVPHIPKVSGLIQKYGDELGIPQQVLDYMMHVVLAHHRRLEFGSPVAPAVPEALFVHYVDNMHGDIFGIFQKIDDSTGSEKFITYGYGTDAMKMLKQSFTDVFKEVVNATANTGDVQKVDIATASEPDLGGF